MILSGKGETMRDYLFIEYTNSLCPECMSVVPAKIVSKEDQVFLLKYCQKHGEQWEILEHSLAYHRRKRQYDKPGTSSQIQTMVNKGCPFDCGLCPMHDQHSCIGLIEVTDHCNLECPTCYAASSKQAAKLLSVEQVERMLDFYVAAEGGTAEILQISGGEPTTHPQILDILRLACSKPLKCVMLNTNGVRIAEDEAFVEQLAVLKGRFEVYLQFDGFGDDVYSALRGKGLDQIKQQAVERLTRQGIPVTLVMTVKNGVNDHQLGKVLLYALEKKYIRGINFQTVGLFGRYAPMDRKKRITLSQTISKLSEQINGMLTTEDFIPLPCNVERSSITYLYRENGAFVPITRNVEMEKLVPVINNTFAFNVEDILKNSREVFGNQLPCSCMSFIKNIIPASFMLKNSKERTDYIDANTFRVSVHSFVDAYNFDMKSMQKECIHIITPDLRRIPFSAYNMIHRESKGGTSDVGISSCHDYKR